MCNSSRGCHSLLWYPAVQVASAIGGDASLGAAAEEELWRVDVAAGTAAIMLWLCHSKALKAPCGCGANNGRAHLVGIHLTRHDMCVHAAD
jgi:hypothetical protein